MQITRVPILLCSREHGIIYADDKLPLFSSVCALNCMKTYLLVWVLSDQLVHHFLFPPSFQLEKAVYINNARGKRLGNLFFFLRLDNLIS